MATIRMTAKEARDYLKNNDAKLQEMYNAAPCADEDPNPEAEPVARGFSAFKEYIRNKEKDIAADILQK